MFFSRKKDIIGLDIGSHAIKIVQLQQNGSEFLVSKAGMKIVDPEMIVDGTIMDAGGISEAIIELMNELGVTTKDVTISVSGHSVIVKKISLPYMTEEELEESIKWEAEQYIPFDINDVNLDYALMKNDETTEEENDNLHLLLVAVKKEKLNEYTSVIMDCGLKPIIVDVDVFALENMYCTNHNPEDGEVVALINIGASIMNINILRNGNFSFTRDISIGGLRYTEEIQKELGLGYMEAEASKCDPDAAPEEYQEVITKIISDLNMEIATEIMRSFDFYKSSSAGESVSKIFLSGGGAKILTLASILEDKLEVPVEKINPFKNIKPADDCKNIENIESIAEHLGICIGLALRRSGDR